MSPSDRRPAAGGGVSRRGGDGLDPRTLAAIVAAVEVAWPRPAESAGAAAAGGKTPWRFSARWWVGRRLRAASRRRQ